MMDETTLNFLKEQMTSPYATVRESTWGFHSDPQPNYGVVDESLARDRAKDQAKINAANGIVPLSESSNSFTDKIKNTNAYKKYWYNREDVLQEVKSISSATHIPENAILSSAENLDRARDVYNLQKKLKEPEKIFDYYPELGELAKKSDTDAAIALHNLKNVRQTQGIVEAAKTGWELDSLMSERGRIGYAALNGKELSEADLKHLEEIKKQQENAKELPTLFEDPAGAIVGGTVQSGKMMLRNMLSGQKMGVYGAGFGAIAGGLIGGGATLGAGTAAGMAAGAKIGWSIGSRIGMAQDMYDEIAGNNYLDYKNYKDKHGKQLLTDNQARAYAAAAAAVETGIEFTNADKILGIVKGGAGAQSLKNIIANAKDSTELQSLLAAYVRNGMKNIGEVTLSESAEEGVQEMSNRIITNFAASNNPGGDIPTYSAKDVIMGGLEASWQALPTSLGFGAGAHAASTVSYARRMAAAMEIKSEEDRANLRTANGLSMLKSLAEDIKVNELFKKAPEVYKEVLKNQLRGTSLETINIDTEMVLNQEGGYELLKSVADKVGMSEEQFNDIVETKADLKINTADYVEENLPEDVNTKLQEYITFDDIGECLARNRQYASRMRREMDRILAFEERQREDALNTFLDKNFPDKEQREVAESVIRRFPDKPAEGVKEIRKALQEKIDAPLREIIEQLKAGAGKGVSIVAVDADGKPTSWEYSDHGRGVRVSNNAPWYRKWFKEHGRAPSEREYRDLAYDIYTGDNYYGLEGWENDSPEEERWYAENKTAIEATEQAIARLNTIAPRLEKIDPGELTITKGLSEEAFEVYKEMRGQLERAESKEARQAAQMNAILFARMADRMAEWHRQAGQTKYTAKDFARSVGVEFGGKAAGQKFNQAISNPNINLDTKVPFIEIEDVFKGQKWWEARDKFPKKIINELITTVSQDMHEPVINESTGFKVVVSKKGSVEHTLSSETSTTKKGTDEAKGRGEKYNNPRHDIDHYNLVPALIKIIKKSVFVEEHPDKHGKALSVYRLYCPIKVGDRKIIAKLTLKKVKTFYRLVDGSFSDILAYDTSIVKKIEDEGPRPQKVADESVSHEGSYLTSSSISIRDMLTDVNDNEEKPFINEDGTGNFSIIDKNGTHDFSGMSGTQYADTFNQKAYHGTPYDFKRFDIGKIGDGVGDQVHGWGLYFAQDRQISENYKEVLGATSGEVSIGGKVYTMDDEGDWYTGRSDWSFGEQVEYGEPLSYALDAMDAEKNKTDAIKSLQKRIDGVAKKTASTEKYIAYLKAAIKILEEGDAEYKNPSRLLEVEIPESDVMLDEQKKYYDQPEKVQQSLNDMFEDLFSSGPFSDNIYAEHKAYINDLENFDNLSGRGVYELLSAGLGSDKEASLKLKEYGVEGITYVGQKDGRCFVVFDDKAVDIIERYNQSAGEHAMTANMDAGQKGLYKIKGQTAFKANGKKVIALFKAADQSTFMHEMAHVYLHDMLELAKLPNAPKQLLDDVKTLSEWASWRPETFEKEYKGTALEREFRKMHEQIADATKYGYLVLDGKEVTLEQLKLQWAQERFARGFENYLREGKAPTESVKTIFRRFKEWLGTIYKAFVQIGGAPSKEVRAVMDRMIASEEEIDIAMSKKGVDSFADAGGMEYLEGNAKQIYMRMVKRAKAEAKEKVLKIALKDVKEDYRKQEKEFFTQEEAEYREKLQAEPVFVIQEHIKNNPDLSTSAVCETLGMSVEEYAAKLKEYGGSLDAAVKAHMREFRKSIDNSGFDAQYFREKAEALVEESKYRKLASTMELNIFEQLAKAQKKINVQSAKNMTLTNDEKGVMGTVDKLNKQSQKIEKLEAEKKEEAAKHREEKKELREKLEAEKKEGIAKHREEKEQIIANVRGLRDAALKHYQEFVDYVERKLETMPIEDANNYQMWRRKSAEAQHNSERAIVTGKWELAVKYKRAQVIYDMFADRAVRNDKKIKKIEEQLTKRRQSIIKNKNISANERYAYNHMLYVFGFVDADAPMPPRYQEENGFMGVLQKSDAPREVDGLFMECPFFTADGFLNLPEWLVSAAMGTTKREQGHKDLSNEQMKMLAQVMNIIYKRGVDDMTLKTIRSVDGKQMSVDDAIAEITAQVRQRIIERTVRDSTGAGDMTKREKAERAINDANQYLVKPEVVLKKMGDLAVKYIYEPLKIAADKELRMAGDMQKKLQNLYSGYSAEELYAMRNDAKYKFGTSMITKEKVIMLALNWGTEINAKRVMDGFRVSELDVKNVLANLTEQDWNLVNDIWSLYDEHWDEVRDIEARMTGAVLEKQPNRAFTIISNDKKSYTLEGGYFPIKYDPRDQRTQEQKADAAAMQQASMSNVAMSLGKGFLKDRTNAKVERRLDLRFEIISGSLADVIHLVAFREPIRDVRRIVLRDDFRSLVNNYLGEAEYKHLRQWTTDCWAEEPIAQSRFEIIAAKLRNAQTMGMMSFRVMTAALNIANAPIVAHYMGTVDMLHALKRFYSAPRKYIDFIFQRSVFMAERAETMDANIYDAIKGPHFMDNVPGVGKAGKFLREHAFKLITWTDLMLALPLWQHEYEKAYNDAVENGRSPQQAQDAGVSAGDAAVRWCFGSGRTVDKAAVQRGRSEFMKQLTMYYSYMSTVYNALNYELWGAKMGYKQAMTWADANKNKELLKAIVKAGSALLAWQLLPAVITALFRAGTSGDDDDLEAEKLLKSIASETLSTLVGGIPVLRDAVPYLLAKAFDEKQFAPRIPIQNTIEQTNRVIQSITNDKKTFGDVMRESGKLLSQTTGAPSTLVDALTTSVTYLETGFDADVSEYLRALILDKKLKNKK